MTVYDRSHAACFFSIAIRMLSSISNAAMQIFQNRHHRLTHKTVATSVSGTKRRIFHTLPYMVVSKIIIYHTPSQQTIPERATQIKQIPQPELYQGFNPKPPLFKVLALNIRAQLSRTCGNCNFIKVSTLSTHQQSPIMFPV